MKIKVKVIKIKVKVMKIKVKVMKIKVKVMKSKVKVMTIKVKVMKIKVKVIIGNYWKLGSWKWKYTISIIHHKNGLNDLRTILLVVYYFEIYMYYSKDPLLRPINIKSTSLLRLPTMGSKQVISM